MSSPAVSWGPTSVPELFPLPSPGSLSLSLTRAVALRLLPRALGSGEDADTEQEGPPVQDK